MNLKGLQGDAVVAKDGEIGPVTDAYFDDQRWALRWGQISGASRRSR
jgi:hypothetical protein